jgi:hypothetical protein
MSAVKALALGALVIATAAGECSAGSISSSNNVRWSWWDPGTGTFTNVATPAPSVAVPVPFVPIPISIPKPASTTSTATVAAYVPPAGVASDASQNSPRWVQVSNAASAYAAAHGGFGPAAEIAPPAASVSPSQPTYNGFINMGNGPYPNATSLATGTPQPWYNSPQIVGLFGGQPNAQQRADFTSTVLQRVEQTYQLSGVPVTLTTDPNALASHTMSLVSNSSSAAVSSSAIGLSYVGGNGISFIDQAAGLVGSVDQLEWVVAHNVSHELMLTFGVGEHHDKSGNFIDAGTANMSMLLNPNATFSQSASQALLGAGLGNSVATSTAAAQVISPTAVPEPSTIALWAVALGGFVAIKGRRARASA